MKEYLIGRSHPETFEIPAKHNAVSRNHAKITIYDDGRWMLEDTNSTQGTFIVKSDGTTIRVSTIQIKPSTKIQLGPANISGYRFTASMVEQNLDPGWEDLQSRLVKLREDETRYKKKATIMRWITRCASFVGMLLSMIVCTIWEPDSSDVKLNINRAFMILPPILVGLISDSMLSGGREKFRKFRTELRCPSPKCRRTLSENDIEYGSCPACGCYKHN